MGACRADAAHITPSSKLEEKSHDTLNEKACLARQILQFNGDGVLDAFKEGHGEVGEGRGANGVGRGLPEMLSG